MVKKMSSHVIDGSWMNMQCRQ